MSKFYGTFTATMETWRKLKAAKGAIMVDRTVIFADLTTAMTSKTWIVGLLASSASPVTSFWYTLVC